MKAHSIKHLFTLAAVSALLASLASATEIRVVSLNVEQGLGPPGSAEHQATRDILARIGGDVIALQELNANDVSGTPSFVDSLSAFLGLPTVHIAETTNVLDGSSRVGFLSRFPIVSSTNIAPPAGARDMTRQIPAVTLDLPGTSINPTILSLHLKCCFDLDDPFRRAVELNRAAMFLQASGITPDDPVIILGDFNLIGFDRAYNEAPSGLPGSFVLGNDIAFPVNYFQAPEQYFSAWSMSTLDVRQLDGSPNTQGSSVLDHIVATTALTSQAHASENLQQRARYRQRARSSQGG